MRPAVARQFIARRTVSRALGLLAIALAIAGWWIWLRPAVFGGPLTFVTVSGTSMQPLFHTGDLAVVRRQARYARGEIIAYHVALPHMRGKAIVIHRIVGGGPSRGFRTKGDNNGWVDPWRPHRQDIVGRLWFHVPDAGGVVTRLSNPVMLGGVLAALTAFVIVAGGKDDKDGKRKSGKRQKRERRGAESPAPAGRSGP